MNPIKGFFISAGLTAAAAIAVLTAPGISDCSAAAIPDMLAVTATPSLVSDVGTTQITATSSDSDDSGDGEGARNRRVEVARA